MAIETFGIVAADILPDLPIDTSAISATSIPLSTGDLTTWIEDASAQLVAVIQRAGLDPASLDDNTQAQMRQAVKAYALGKSLGVLYLTSASEAALTRWDSIKAHYSASPRSLAGRGSRVLTTIEATSTPPTRFFTGPGNKF